MEASFSEARAAEAWLELFLSVQRPLSDGRADYTDAICGLAAYFKGEQGQDAVKESSSLDEACTVKPDLMPAASFHGSDGTSCTKRFNSRKTASDWLLQMKLAEKSGELGQSEVDLTKRIAAQVASAKTFEVLSKSQHKDLAAVAAAGDTSLSSKVPAEGLDVTHFFDGLDEHGVKLPTCAMCLHKPTFQALKLAGAKNSHLVGCMAGKVIQKDFHVVRVILQSSSTAADVFNAPKSSARARENASTFVAWSSAGHDPSPRQFCRSSLR